MIIMFRDGGPFMYFVLGAFIVLMGLALLMTIVAIASRFKTMLIWPARIFSFLGLGANLGTLLIGALGYFQGMQMVNSALESASDDMKEALLKQGSEVAYYPLSFATTLMFVGGAMWLVPFFIAMIPVSKNYDELLDD